MRTTFDSLPAAESGARILVDDWYAEALAPYGATSLKEAIAERFPSGPFAPGSRLARKARGLLWFIVARDAERVICNFSAPGLALFLFLQVLARRRSCQVYLVEFLRPKRPGARAWLIDTVHDAIFRWLLPRTLSGAQVATPWEGRVYAEQYGVPESRFRYIPRSMVRQPSKLPDEPMVTTGVFSSGRAACDWPTLFAAAKGTTWPLTVVCAAKDRAAVNALNHDGRAKVLCEIAPEEHQRMLSEATVCALVMSEQHVSSGHVRLSRAVESGVPVVASSVIGLQGYLVDGTTALAVPVGDAIALREAIGALMADPELRRSLRRRAYETTQSRTHEAYMEQIRAFVLQDQPEAAAGRH